MSFAAIFRGMIDALDAAPVHPSRAPLGDKTGGALVRHREISVGYDGLANFPQSHDREELLGRHVFPLELRHRIRHSDPVDSVIDAVTDVESVLEAIMKRPELNLEGMVTVSGWVGPVPTKSGDELRTRIVVEVLDLYEWSLET